MPFSNADVPENKPEESTRDALLHRINLSQVRSEERLINLTRDVERMTQAQQAEAQHVRNNIKMVQQAIEAKVEKLPSAEALKAIADRVEVLENNWTWLIRVVIGTPIIGMLTWLGLTKGGGVVK
jgi:hypothetical protein